jgi:hypothetical protein
MKDNPNITMLKLLFIACLLGICALIFGCFVIVYHDENNTCWSTNFNYYTCVDHKGDK